MKGRKKWIIISVASALIVLLVIIAIIMLSSKTNQNNPPEVEHESGVQDVEEEAQGESLDISDWFVDGEEKKTGTELEEKEPSINSSTEDSKLKDSGDEHSEEWGPIY